MKNKINGNEKERQEIRSILEDISKDISKDWDKITDVDTFKLKYYSLTNDLLPKMLDGILELEKEWGYDDFKVNSDKYTATFISEYKYNPDFDLFRRIQVQDIKTIHQLNHYMIGTLVTLIKLLGELVTYLGLVDPTYDNTHESTVIQCLGRALTKNYIRFSNIYKTLGIRDSRTFSPEKLVKYHLVEDMTTLQQLFIENNTLFIVRGLQEIKQELFITINSLYINQDNWRDIEILLSQQQQQQQQLQQ